MVVVEALAPIIPIGARTHHRVAIELTKRDLLPRRATVYHDVDAAAALRALRTHPWKLIESPVGLPEIHRWLEELDAATDVPDRPLYRRGRLYLLR